MKYGGSEQMLIVSDSCITQTYTNPILQCRQIHADLRPMMSENACASMQLVSNALYLLS